MDSAHQHFEFSGGFRRDFRTDHAGDEESDPASCCVKTLSYEAYHEMVMHAVLGLRRIRGRRSFLVHLSRGVKLVWLCYNLYIS